MLAQSLTHTCGTRGRWATRFQWVWAFSIYIYKELLLWHLMILSHKLSLQVKSIMNCSSKDVWVGLRRRSVNWIWTDGSVLTTDHWDSGYPRDGDDCVVSESTAWRSVNCDTRQRVACFNLGIWATKTLATRYILTHCGLVTPHGIMDLGQHWLG